MLKLKVVSFQKMPSFCLTCDETVQSKDFSSTESKGHKVSLKYSHGPLSALGYSKLVLDMTHLFLLDFYETCST